MPSIQDSERSTLKLAQFKLFCSKEKRIDNKYIELVLQDFDPSLKVSSKLLHLVYEKRHVDIFESLIQRGADFTVKDSQGNTVLRNAFQYFCSDSSKWKSDSYSATEKLPFIASTLSAHVKYRNINNPSDLNGLTHFHVACAINNTEAVAFFLNNGVPVDQAVTKTVSKKYFKGYTALHFAVQFGCLEVIRILLEHKSNAILKDSSGKTPLHVALERNIAMVDSAKNVFSPEDIAVNEQVIKLLVDHDQPAKIMHLHIASSMQNTLEVEKLLVQKPDVNQCIHMDSKVWPGYTGLHFAAHVNVDTVKLLVKHGADIEAKDAHGVTPFDLCIDRYKVEDISDLINLVPKWKNIVLSDGKTEFIDLLLAFKDSDAISNFLQKSDDNVKLFVPLDSPLWPGLTLLHISVLLSERKKSKLDYKKHKNGHYIHFQPDLTIITELLNQGADVTVKDQRNWTPIHLAYQVEKDKVTNLLLNYHYKMQNPVDDDNLSHLHIACATKHKNFVERLLWNGLDPNVAYKGKTFFYSVFPGSTPLHIAILEGEEKIAKVLLKFGADPHAQDASSFTPMHYLVREDFSFEFTEKIFSSPDFYDRVVEDVGMSYLHVACNIPNVDAVRRLLDLGADVNGVITQEKLNENSDCLKIWNFDARDGSRPLHIALRSFNCSEVVVGLLIERGGDLLAKNSRGESPLYMILEFGYESCLDALLAALNRDEDLRRRVEMETGVTMLHVACHKVEVDLVKELLGRGADVTAKIHEDERFRSGYTPLHLAYEKLTFPTVDDLSECLTQVSLLLKFHKNFQVNPTDDWGISHFHIACHMLEVEVVENFLNLGQVNVNATIDVFYDDDSKIAACSPLLLATRTTSWREKKPSAQLKVVDLLIEHGAEVDAEDIDGNTPAHYAAYCSSTDENYLQRLAKGGANVNATNVRGETPLELLIKESSSTGGVELKDIRYFISCGCILNAFTFDTEEGFIARVNTMLSQKDMEILLRETSLKYPHSMNRDSMNRNAIHNLVATKFYETDETGVAELIDILTGFGCDVDDQDDLGRTPLHLAARFRNKIAVEGLLLVGADIKIMDHDHKTPFAYVFEPCSCTEFRYGFKYRCTHTQMYDVFVNHIKKMNISRISVDDANDDLLDEAEYRFDPEESRYSLDKFRSDFQRMSLLAIEPYKLPLSDFMSKAVYDYPRMSDAKREAIDEYFERNRSVFRDRFPDAAGIFRLQYRQAVLRRKMMIAAKDALSVLARFQVPDVCSDIILRFLENDELRNLIASTARVETCKLVCG